MNYEQAVLALKGSMRFGINPSLAGIRQLTEALGNPQAAYDAVQVAGTNGKGSTARMLAAILRAEGLSTSLFTSPHLYGYEEQFEIDGVPVARDTFADAVSRVLAAARVARLELDEDLTEFELATAVALVLSADAGVDVAVLEAGLGGRWDATSVVVPRVAVLTTLGLDHVEHLGGTVQEIAAEKVQIIRAGTVGVVGPGFSAGLEVARKHAAMLGTHVTAVSESDELAGEFTFRRDVQAGPAGHVSIDVRSARREYLGLHVRGASYQAANAAAAIVAAEIYLGRALDVGRVQSALDGVRFVARFDVFSREGQLVVVDGAHNDDAARALAASLPAVFRTSRPALVVGMLREKNPEAFLAELHDAVSGVYCAQPDSPRAMSADVIGAACASTFGGCEMFADIPEALRRALESGADGVLVAGSLVTAAQARSYLIERGFREE